MTPTTTIETLQKDVDLIATELAEAKKLEDEALQKIQAEAAALKAEMTLNKVKTAKEEANIKLKSLEGKTDAISKAEIVKLEAEIKKYEAMLITLNSTKDELITLKAGVVAPIVDENDDKNKDEEKDEEKPEEEKKNRFRRQIDGFSDKTEENHGLKNAGRIAMGIGAGVLARKGIKRLFGIGKKKETTNADGTPKTTEEKSFWQKPFGKFLKWTGIGTGAYYLIHGLYTGKWGLSDFLDWNKRNETNPEDIKSRYEKNVEASLKPKYEKFGGLVDDYRTKLDKKSDSLGTLEDEEGKETTMPKGCIPALLDDAYTNVGDILDTDNYIVDKWKDAGGKLRDAVKGVGSKAFGLLLKPFAGVIKGLKSTFFGSDGTPNEEFQTWAETKDLTRDEQVANLMQKYSMVRSYLEDKKEQLARKYAIQQLASENVTSPTEEQIQDALVKYDDIIKERIQTNFLDKKIAAASDGDSIVDTLAGEDIYDDSASEGTVALTDAVKERKAVIVPKEDIRERAKASTDINKDTALLTELSGVSTRFGAYLKEGLLHRNILEKMFNCRGILNLDELWNGKNDDLEEAMDKLGLNDEVKKFKAANVEFMNKLTKKTLTKDDIIKFQETIDDYFVLEQKVLLDAETQNKEESAGNLPVWIMGRLYELVSTPTGRTIMIVGAGYAKFKGVRTVVNSIVSVPLTVFKGTVVKPIFRNVNVTSTFGINKRLKLKIYGKTTAAYDKFIKNFKEGKLPGTTADQVFSVRKADWGANTKSLNEILVDKLNLRKVGTLEAIDQASLIKQYCDSDNIRNIIKKTNNMDFGDLAVKLNTYDVKVKSLSGDRKIFCQALFENSSFTKLDDIDNIVKNIETINIDGLTTTKELKKIAKALGKDISTLTTADEINAKITEIKKTKVTVKPIEPIVENLSESQKALKTKIEDKISILKKKYSASGATALEKATIDESIGSLEDVVKDIKSIPEDEAVAMKKLFSLGIDIKYTSKILEVKDVKSLLTKIDAAKDVSELELALKGGKLDDLAKTLKTANKMDDLLKEFKPLAKTLIPLMEEGKDALKIVKAIAKVAEVI